MAARPLPRSRQCSPMSRCSTSACRSSTVTTVARTIRRTPHGRCHHADRRDGLGSGQRQSAGAGGRLQPPLHQARGARALTALLAVGDFRLTPASRLARGRARPIPEVVVGERHRDARGAFDVVTSPPPEQLTPAQQVPVVEGLIQIVGRLVQVLSAQRSEISCAYSCCPASARCRRSGSFPGHPAGRTDSDPSE